MDIPIIDPHHHLWAHTKERYLLDEFVTDLATVPNVVATVYSECSAMYRQSGPDHLRCVGEAEFAAGMAAMSASGLFGPVRICAGFVGAADLTSGDAVDEVLDAMATASGGRLRGIRGTANWDADPGVNTGTRPFAPEGLLADARFRKGFARLARRGLVYDAWQYHPQLDDVGRLAHAHPDTVIVVNHCGGLLGIGPYAKNETFAQWKALVAGVARYPNVVMKLGGLSAKRCGFTFVEHTPEELARAWAPYITTCIELFGPDRCMFESNTPPDKVAGSYATLWKAFELLAQPYSPSERMSMFNGTAARVYKV